MSDKNSEGPKTVPLKKTSSIPLKKETVRVSVKSAPSMSINTRALAPQSPLKTEPVKNAPKPVSLNTQAVSSKPAPLRTVPLKAAPKPAALNTVPMSTKPNPLKTIPLKTAPKPSSEGSAPAMPTAAPASSKPMAPVPTIKLSAPKPTASPSGLVTQPIAAPKPLQKPVTASVPADIAVKPLAPISADAPVVKNPQPTMASSKIEAYEDKEEANPNAGWPLAAAALFCALVCLAANVFGFLAGN